MQSEAAARFPIRRIIFASSGYPQADLSIGIPKEKMQRQILHSLKKPSWSVREMIPSKASPSQETVSTNQVKHLLKLSALHMSEDKMEQMRTALNSHIFFVQQVQQIDTTGVEPCVAIRDESDAHIANSTVTLDSLRSHLDKEKKVGTNGTVRREKPTEMVRESGWNHWDMGKGTESRKKGNYYFVRKDKSQEIEG